MHSKFTVFLGTILVGLLSLIPGAFIGAITYSEDKNKIVTCTLISSLLGAWLMYRYYQKQNRQYNDAVQLRRGFRAEIETKRKEAEQAYVNNSITKRQYEVLMSQIRRMEK
jgi:hypothetical protein